MYGLAEQAHGRYLCLAIVNDAPVVFTGHRIEIPLAQKALIVALDQLIDSVGVAAIFGEVDLDGAGVLLPPVHGFYFLIPPQIFRHSGRR